MTGGGATGAVGRWGDGRRGYRGHGEVGAGGGSTGAVGRWGREEGLQGPWGAGGREEGLQGPWVG